MMVMTLRRNFKTEIRMMIRSRLSVMMMISMMIKMVLSRMNWRTMIHKTIITKNEKSISKAKK